MIDPRLDKDINLLGVCPGGLFQIPIVLRQPGFPGTAGLIHTLAHRARRVLNGDIQAVQLDMSFGIITGLDLLKSRFCFVVGRRSCRLMRQGIKGRRQAGIDFLQLRPVRFLLLDKLRQAPLFERRRKVRQILVRRDKLFNERRIFRALCCSGQLCHAATQGW